MDTQIYGHKNMCIQQVIITATQPRHTRHITTISPHVSLLVVDLHVHIIYVHRTSFYPLPPKRERLRECERVGVRACARTLNLMRTCVHTHRYEEQKRGNADSITPKPPPPHKKTQTPPATTITPPPIITLRCR